ncbi:RagB/SusD family nutrient uptake outer membrane protein [Chitinophaga pinensis]|uniref:RagB/SusD domain protein n=1 Tax=Chitinophaga pinensis (strain ATCC 43595 / DSM 2588 / LMG 13176 / NBRC 15968 / NCIMB 11800 / UQM 2034) TaxID=485918 RepID=A0A979G7V6_CHIPD|nr:RagB/SusD family nutrient uptake outer membrane protein [Chitinophaga pinensis]ACU62252.1 RagB/SusD domain protein [Chitinophaga pinensis DSM 2588]
MKYISFLLVITVICSSCSKFLEEDPTAHLSTTTYYKTAADAEAAVNAVYAAARPQNFFALETRIAVGDIMSDDAEKGGGGASDVAEMQQLKLFVAKPDNGYVEGAWQANFHGIYLANLVLDRVPPIAMNETDKQRILGQARFFRAYFYLQLMELFGNVPLITKPLQTGDYNQPQATPAQVWAQIELDADSAIAVLPQQSELTVDKQGKATVGAAKALLLYAYLWQQKWADAQRIGDEIINSGQYTLAADYTKIFTSAGEFNTGSIFEINMANVPGKNVGSNINLWQNPRNTWGYGFVCPTQNLVNSFETGDPRLKATVIANGDVLPDGSVANTTSSQTGYYNKKYWLPQNEIPYNNGGGAGDGPTNERIYRLAVVMLWTAEAAVHNGDAGHATDLVNKVRERARKSGGNTDMGILPPYGTVTLDNIYHEQRVETALGDHIRFFELVRTGKAAGTLPGYKEGVHNHLPIPLREIQLSNGLLRQNQGY